jgi:PTH2 family peptidyl-tRNA hydrolase
MVLVMKLAILVRKDLEMGCGKIAGQVGHACVLAYHYGDKYKIRMWMIGGVQKKIVLKVPDKLTLWARGGLAESAGIKVQKVVDLGLTQVEPNTTTCIAIGPDEDEKIDKITKGLSLL